MKRLERSGKPLEYLRRCIRRSREAVTVYLIAGLGNPTSKYEKTRHNVGFDVLDALSETYQIPMWEKRGHALCGSGWIEGRKVLLVKPQTYMNLSGDAVSQLASFYRLDPESEVIVVCDDITLSPGNLRVRRSGSAGGHNGLKDIIAKLHSDRFSRVKIGVGDKPAGGDLVAHVLGRFSKEERQRVDEAIEDAVKAVTLMVGGETDKAMNLYNRKKYE